MLKAYHHLTRDERFPIYALKKRGLTQTDIATDIGGSQGTISRELTRNKQWSPEQICGALNLDDGTKVSPESLSRHIWTDKRRGGTLYLHLRQRGKNRNKRGAATAGRGLIPGRIDIAQRPQIVDAKSRLGDWELDSIIGAKHRGAITSMVERKTKLTKLVLLDGPTSKATTSAIISRLEPLKKHVLTLTSDNGKEFAGQAKISEKLGS